MIGFSVFHVDAYFAHANKSDEIVSTHERHVGALMRFCQNALWVANKQQEKWQDEEEGRNVS